MGPLWAGGRCCRLVHLWGSVAIWKRARSARSRTRCLWRVWSAGGWGSREPWVERRRMVGSVAGLVGEVRISRKSSTDAEACPRVRRMQANGLRFRVGMRSDDLGGRVAVRRGLARISRAGRSGCLFAGRRGAEGTRRGRAQWGRLGTGGGRPGRAAVLRVGSLDGEGSSVGRAGPGPVSVVIPAARADARRGWRRFLHGALEWAEGAGRRGALAARGDRIGVDCCALMAFDRQGGARALGQLWDRGGMGELSVSR